LGCNDGFSRRRFDVTCRRGERGSEKEGDSSYGFARFGRVGVFGVWVCASCVGGARGRSSLRSDPGPVRGLGLQARSGVCLPPDGTRVRSRYLSAGCRVYAARRGRSDCPVGWERRDHGSVNLGPARPERVWRPGGLCLVEAAHPRLESRQQPDRPGWPLRCPGQAPCWWPCARLRGLVPGSKTCTSCRCRSGRAHTDRDGFWLSSSVSTVQQLYDDIASYSAKGKRDAGMSLLAPQSEVGAASKTLSLQKGNLCAGAVGSGGVCPAGSGSGPFHARGRKTKNSVPLPTSLSTWIQPL